MTKRRMLDMRRCRIVFACLSAMLCMALSVTVAPSSAFASEGASLQAGAIEGVGVQATYLYQYGYHITFSGVQDKGVYQVALGDTVTPDIRVINNYGIDVTSQFVSFTVYESTYEYGENGFLTYDWNEPTSFPVPYGKYAVRAMRSNGDYLLGLLEVYGDIEDADIDFGDAYRYYGGGNFADESDLRWAIPSGALAGPVVRSLYGVELDSSDYSIEYYSASTHQSVGTSMPTSVGMYYCIIVADEDSFLTGGSYSQDFVITKSISSASVMGVEDKTYSGGAKTQDVQVYVDNRLLSEGRDYTVSYAGNVNPGEAVMTFTGKGYYTGTKNEYFEIDKMGNTMKVKLVKKTVKVKAGSVATAKKVLARNMKVKKAAGKVTYKNASSNKKAKKFKVNAKNGKVTIPAGTQPGTYKIKVKVTAKGDKFHEKKSKTVSYKIKVS